jgi:hypothetical protein
MKALARALQWWIGAAAAHPWPVVLAALLLAAVSLAYTSATLRIDTDTTDMIAADVPFRQHDRAFARAFPAFSHPIVAVVEGQVPERVRLAATALADALRADEAHFSAVDDTAGLPFFAEHGLLYLDVDDLALLTERLADAQPQGHDPGRQPQQSRRGQASLAEIRAGARTGRRVLEQRPDGQPRRTDGLQRVGSARRHRLELG